jgi:apolipoprotein N-acyltransferase
VCFDSIYESLTLDSVRDGAELIVLSTNDSWYKDSAAVRQHNGHAVLRAVENGRCVVRAANTGISTVISDKGRIITSLPPLTDGYVFAEVSTSDQRTLFSYTGNLTVLLSAIYIAFLFVRAIILKIKAK